MRFCTLWFLAFGCSWATRWLCSCLQKYSPGCSLNCLNLESYTFLCVSVPTDCCRGLAGTQTDTHTDKHTHRPTFSQGPQLLFLSPTNWKSKFCKVGCVCLFIVCFYISCVCIIEECDNKLAGVYPSQRPSVYKVRRQIYSHLGFRVMGLGFFLDCTFSRNSFLSLWCPSLLPPLPQHSFLLFLLYEYS